MKVLHFYNGSDFFSQEVPWFEWDRKSAEYLKTGAKAAYEFLLGSQDEYHTIKSIYDTVKVLRLNLDYSSEYTNGIYNLETKGFGAYCDALEEIMAKLAAMLYWLDSISTTEDEKEKSFYRRHISAYKDKVRDMLNLLKTGKIAMTMRDGKTRTFEYIYTTANELDYRGMLFYAPETREIKDFEGEVERKIFKR